VNLQGLQYSGVWLFDGAAIDAISQAASRHVIISVASGETVSTFSEIPNVEETVVTISESGDSA